MSSDLTAEALKEFQEWALRQTFAGKDNSPEYYVWERHVTRILEGLTKHVSDDPGDRYPVEEYLKEEDIVWLKSQRTTEIALDRKK